MPVESPDITLWASFVKLSEIGSLKVVSSMFTKFVGITPEANPNIYQYKVCVKPGSNDTSSSLVHEGATTGKTGVR